MISFVCVFVRVKAEVSIPNSKVDFDAISYMAAL